MKTYTIEQIRASFATSFAIEDKQKIADKVRESMNPYEAAEIVGAIIENDKEHAAKYPEEAAAMAEWTQLDRILWIVKETYVLGVIQGLELAATANTATLDELEKPSDWRRHEGEVRA